MLDALEIKKFPFFCMINTAIRVDSSDCLRRFCECVVKKRSANASTIADRLCKKTVTIFKVGGWVEYLVYLYRYMGLAI